MTYQLNVTKGDWVFCFVKDNCFEAACGIFNLTEAIQIFREWTEKV
ncbi:MAG: hypothetical protein K940chlam7_01131 [Chlamydiae bacterium]|nr:hypothetical protein [Chlamydiota bacterium]